MGALLGIPISRSWSNPFCLEELIEQSEIAYFDECPRYGFNEVYLMAPDYTVKEEAFLGVGLSVYDGGLYASTSGYYIPVSIEEIAGPCYLLGQGRKEIEFIIWAFWQLHIGEIKNLNIC